MRIFLVISIFLFFFAPHNAEALSFGGRVVSIIPCTCQIGGIAIYVAMPKPPYVGMFLWQLPITRPYLWYVPYPKVAILGNYIPGGICMVGAPPVCVPIPLLGTITQVGTSLR